MINLIDLVDKKGSCSIPVRGRADVWTFYLRRWGNHFFRSDAGEKIELWGLDEEGETYLKGLKYGQRFMERVEGDIVHFDKIY
jgi:hypothetical protein